jgi:hypothetical protein
MKGLDMLLLFRIGGYQNYLLGQHNHKYSQEFIDAANLSISTKTRTQGQAMNNLTMDSSSALFHFQAQRFLKSFELKGLFSIYQRVYCCVKDFEQQGSE